MTFNDYGVREGDSIIALSKEDSSSFDNVNLWISLTRDHEAFNECICSMLNPETSGEAARLRDLHLTRMESMPRPFARMCTPFLNQYTEAVMSPPTILSSQSPRSPSEEALPVPWDLADVQPRLVEGGRKRRSHA
jgi:hypothetical protein